MSIVNIVGRREEIARLDRCMEALSAQLIIVYGRRRVGKTYLINEYYNHKFAFKLTGAYKRSKAFQLESFADEMRQKSGKTLPVPANWREAFRQLREYLETLPEEEKHVVFIDEMPWLDTPHSDYLPLFEWFWNDWASTRSNFVFIVCGSATSWMTDNISDNKGGLFNRQSCRIYLEPFTLHETEEFLRFKGIEWSRYEIAECYMIMGGIPYYLNLLDPAMSYTQNIDNLFFKKRGELWDEFDHLYATLFSNSDSHIKIVEALSSKKGGLTRSEITQKTGNTITVDGKEYNFKKVWIAPTMNGKYYGGGMIPAPNQKRLSDDKIISVMVFGGWGRIRTLMAFPSIFKGEHVNKKCVTVIEGKDITVEFDGPRPLQIDGETILGVTSYEAKV